MEIAAKDGVTIERANAWASMAELGILSSESTPEQVKAIETGESGNETLITCAKCGVPTKIGAMMTVWIHRACPSASEVAE